MVSRETMEFLRDLKQNNNREWFEKNRTRYLEAKQNVEWAISLVIHELGQLDPGVRGLRPADCMFRIFRDVRFSKNKEPYKNNFGAFISKGGRKSPHAGYYLHLEPGDCFLAGGLYMPESSLLKRVREEIMTNPDEFREIIEDPAFRKHFGQLSGEQLKRPPAGVPPDFQPMEWLKFKSYLVIKQIPEETVISGDYLKLILEVFSAMMPLNRFMNQVVDQGDLGTDY